MYGCSEDGDDDGGRQQSVGRVPSEASCARYNGKYQSVRNGTDWGTLAEITSRYLVKLVALEDAKECHAPTTT